MVFTKEKFQNLQKWVRETQFKHSPVGKVLDGGCHKCGGAKFVKMSQYDFICQKCDERYFGVEKEEAV